MAVGFSSQPKQLDGLCTHLKGKYSGSTLCLGATIQAHLLKQGLKLCLQKLGQIAALDHGRAVPIKGEGYAELDEFF